MNLNQPTQAETPPPQEPNSERDSSPIVRLQKQAKASVKVVMIPSNHDTVIPRHHATKQPRYRDTVIESVRSAVKVFGKEAATHRFTAEEKKAIRDIVYAYESQDIRTNENEISRIGVNYLIEDYHSNGENSILHKVLKALNG